MFWPSSAVSRYTRLSPAGTPESVEVSRRQQSVLDGGRAPLSPADGRRDVVPEATMLVQAENEKCPVPHCPFDAVLGGWKLAAEQASTCRAHDRRPGGLARTRSGRASH